MIARRGRSALAAGLVGLAGLILPSMAAGVERPIVYVIVLDGLDGDSVDAGRAPFIASLIENQSATRATYYRESRALMVAETNPNHVGMMTGAYTATSGIPSNYWAIYGTPEGEESCALTGPADFSRLPTYVTGENANCLQAPTVFESLRRQGDPDGLLTAGVFGKPKLGRLFAGRNLSPDRLDVDYLWAPCDSDPGDEAYCEPVRTNPVSGYALDDRTVMDRVLATVRNGVPAPDGGRRRPDLTFVNLHQIDSVGHAFGRIVNNLYDLAISQADDEVERLVSELRSRGEWERTVMILLSDHSMDTTLAKTALTSRFEQDGIPEDSFLAIGKSSVDTIYLADRTSPSRFELLRRMRASALQSQNVAEALYREPNPVDGGSAHTLDGVHPGWHAAGPRSPDLFVTHVPGGSFADPDFSEQPLPGHHGAPHTRDNFFAVLGGSPGIVDAERSGERAPDFDDTLVNVDQAENVDVAATVSGLLGLAPPAGNQGRFLSEAFDLRAIPGGGRPAVRPLLTVRRGTARRGRRRAYVLSWQPGSGRYDLEARSCGRTRALLSNSPATSRGIVLRRSRRYRLRVRALSAAGVPGDWATRTIGPRRSRC